MPRATLTWGELLPPLIAECEQAARRLSGAGRKVAFNLTAETYRATSAVTAKLRETDLAWIAGDRSVTAAELVRGMIRDLLRGVGVLLPEAAY